ncbi:MAG: VWA domain-containing protein, partial [Planctomycetota bacterium]|nr:VWA domain-containing protein [Planctomycetota bacterium]
ESRKLLSATAGSPFETYDRRALFDTPSLPPAQIVINDVTIDEGGIATLTISATRPLTGNVHVDWTTEDITATSGLDYLGASGTLELGPNIQSITIAIATSNDSIAEGNELFRVILSGPIGAVLRDSEGIVTIREPGPVTGAVSGNVWDDLNQNGVRDGILAGDTPYVVFVIDVSGSTGSGFTGQASIGDVNSDGLQNTVLDAEIQAFIDLNNELIRTGFAADGRVSIVTFSDGAQVVSELIAPGVDVDGNNVSDVEDALRRIRIAGGTNYRSGLLAAQAVLDNSGADPANHNVIFLSDGEPDANNAFAEVAQQLRDSGANVRAFGASNSGSRPGQLQALQQIDANAVIFESPDELRNIFGNLNGPGSISEPGLAGITVYADLNGNGVFDSSEDVNGDGLLNAGEDLNSNGQLDLGEPSTISMPDDPSTSTDETGNYVLTGLAAGSTEIRQVLHPDRTQTFPSSNGDAHSVTISDGAIIDNLDFGSVSAPREFLVSIGSHTGYTLAVVHVVAIPTGGTVEIVTTSDSLVISHNGRELRRIALPDDATVGIWGSDLDDDVVIRPNNTGSRVDISFAAGAGDDTVAVVGGDLLTQGGLHIYGGAGNDTIDLSQGTADRAFAHGGDGDDTLIGSAGRDLLSGDSGADSILAGAGNDILSGDLGAAISNGVDSNDVLDGGSGTDIVFEYGDVNLTLTNTTLVGLGDDQLRSIEAAWIIGGQSGNLFNASGFVTSTGRGVMFDGKGGNDTLVGTNGNDTLMGGNGDDLIVGLSGNDSLVGGAGADTVKGGGGSDTINGGDGNDVIQGNAGDDSLLGGSGDDVINGQSGRDTISGEDGDDILAGQAGRDFIFGGEGNDVIDGGAGNDVLSGAGGEDSILGQAGRDLIDGGSGNDLLNGGGSDDFIRGGDGNDTLSGGEGQDTLQGGKDNDSVLGGSGDDVISGQDGNDTLNGGVGNDVLAGNDGTDLIFGGAGNDFITDLGSTGDTLIGGSGDDTIQGDLGDTIIAGMPQEFDDEYSLFDDWAGVM